jgi:hypothetical protein
LIVSLLFFALFHFGLMSRTVATARDGLQVIAELCGALGFKAPAVELLTAEQLPSAFRLLLVHTTGMSWTLERHWRESICVELLSDEISVEQRSLFRFVVLRTQSSAQSVEIALIRIPLESFEPALASGSSRPSNRLKRCWPKLASGFTPIRKRI